MKVYKKLTKTITLLILSFCLILFTGCNNNYNDDDKLNIVCTIFPGYNWCKVVLGEIDANVTLLLDNGTDSHSYSPTVEDIAKISRSDLFLYVGGESEEWVKNALKNVSNKDMITINMMDVLKNKLKEEEPVDGSKIEDGNKEYDEHVWLSLKNAITIIDKIKDELVNIDEANKDIYKENASDYIDRLTALDIEYSTYLESCTNKTLLFADRFPFRYLVDDYNLKYYAAFAGCSAETEASFTTVIFLVGKIDELGLKTILIIDSSDGRLANQIRNETKTKDQEILMLNSMQSITLDDYKNGITYYTTMLYNLNILKKALE